MRIKWLVLLSLTLLVVAIAAERFTHYRVQAVRARHIELEKRLTVAEGRQWGRSAELLKYGRITAAAKVIAATQENAPTDPTQLLRWFADASACANVRIISSKILTAERDGGMVAGGAYNRVRFELDLSGEYAPLVNYMARIESSGQPMVVDAFSIFADRGAPGSGKLKIFVSCLTPVSTKKSSSAQAR